MPSARRRGAFTLLEVLAATVIMAMFYGVLTAKGVEGFALEGDADRRLRASLVADRQLADLEAAWAAGLPPRPGRVEAEEDGFTVRVDVGPAQLPAELLEPGGAAAEGGRSDPARSLPSLLAPARGQPAVLLSVHVTVGWRDAFTQRSVERTTFVLDSEAVAERLGQAGLMAGLDAQGNAVFGGAPAGGDGGRASR